MKLDLAAISRCLHGVLPSMIATVGADGTPNVTYISHVYSVDGNHVALSCQFFNKTRLNLAEVPYANVQLFDPVTFEVYRMDLRYVRSEYEGPLFERMRERLDTIASHTGMTGIFRLLSADVCEVLEVYAVPGFLNPPVSGQELNEVPPDEMGPNTEVRGLQFISSQINAARSLEELFDCTLLALQRALGFEYSMLLLLDEDQRSLFTVASHGYGESGVGAEVRVGEGLIGRVAAYKRPVRAGGLISDLRYGRAIRAQAVAAGHLPNRPEIPLPGLPQAQSQMALPLVICDRLLGVLAVESPQPFRFDQWHEAFLNVITNQVALAIERLSRDDAEILLPRPRAHSPVSNPLLGSSQESLAEAKLPHKHTFWFFPNDDCVFLDGEYLVRNIPGKILWKLLQGFQHGGRREFTNRELRLDTSLGLPPIKDNLESRLILLRRRLEDKCAHVRIVPVKRGRFALEIDGAVELVERSGNLASL